MSKVHTWKELDARYGEVREKITVIAEGVDEKTEMKKVAGKNKVTIETLEVVEHSARGV